jgi:hypothetical protein
MKDIYQKLNWIDMLLRFDCFSQKQVELSHESQTNLMELSSL